MVIYGVPVGHDSFVIDQLEKRVQEVAGEAARACKLLANERQALWTLLRASMKYQFEYWLGLVYPSLVKPAARAMDRVLWEVLEAVVGQHIPQEEEQHGWEECLEIPIQELNRRSIQSWLVGLPVRLGGMGLTSQEELAPIAFLSSLQQAIPYYGGERAVCPTLAHLAGAAGDRQWENLLQSDCRTGRELQSLWLQLQQEAARCSDYLGKEPEGHMFEPVESAGKGLTSRELRRTLCREREHTRREVFDRAVKQQSATRQKGPALSSVKERDKLSTAFLLSLPGPRYGLSSGVFAEALATLLAMPSRVCLDRVGEKVGGSRVDQFGIKVINATLPGGHWTTRHNTIEHELAALCNYAELPAECEPYGLFGHLLPQEALHRLQRQRRQVLRPDLRLEVPPTTIKYTPKKTAAEPRPAPVSKEYCGSMIAEVKTIGKGVKSWYKVGTTGNRAVDTRAEGIQGKYEAKAAGMDEALGVVGEGPCMRRLREFPPVLDLCFGAFAEGSPGVHILISLLATSRVRKLELRGKVPAANQLGLEIAIIRRRLSTAAVRANNTCLLSRMGQVGEGSSMAGRRRAAARWEEQRMELEAEADWLCHTSGRELVQRGRFWTG